jgi:hypothetical protein
LHLKHPPRDLGPLLGFATTFWRCPWSFSFGFEEEAGELSIACVIYSDVEVKSQKWGLEAQHKASAFTLFQENVKRYERKEQLFVFEICR